MPVGSQADLKSGRILRVLIATAVGIGVTFGLLFLMQLLIEMGDSVYTDTPEFDLQIGIPPSETVPEEPTEPPPMRPPEPVPAPGFTYSQEIISDPLEPVVAAPISPEGTGFGDLNIDASADGPLVSVLKVKPPYPAPALIDGLEGFVIVQYDVLLSGAVDNVVILESSDEVFNAVAVEAIGKFRYKPKVIDGVAQESRGLKRMFQFEIGKRDQTAPE